MDTSAKTYSFMASCTDKYFSVNCCRSYKEMNALLEFNLSKNLFIEGLAKSFSRKFIVSHVSLGLALGLWNMARRTIKTS